MITDKLDTFSDAQSLVGTLGNYLADKSKDLWSGLAALPTDTLVNMTLRDPGRGTDVEVVGTVTTSFASSGSTGTVQMQLVMADDENLSTNLVVLASSPAAIIPVAGHMYKLAIPPNATKRFLGVRWVTAVQDASAGKVSAFLVPCDGSGDAVVSA